MSNSSETESTPEKFNLDPITGSPASHPLGVGVGAASGAGAGLAIGAVGGPLAAVVSGVVGAVLGGLAGKGVGEVVNPTAEAAFWEENHRHQPYAGDEKPYEGFAVAYLVGIRGFREGRSFEECEADLREEYEQAVESEAKSMEYHMSTRPLHEPSPSTVARDPGSMEDNLSTRPLAWDDARLAVRAAFERIREGARSARGRDRLE